MYEPGSFRPLAQWEAGEQDERLHYIVTDVAGTARELCSEAGDIIWRGEQRLWGNHRTDVIPQHLRRFLGDAANEETYCEQRYQGQIYDQETGLYYNRHRYFDLELGQYISPDPIGFAGGLRPQGYVHNPLEWVDPLGLFGEKPLNSPDPAKWLDKGGTVWNELDGTWVYQNAAGTTVRYPNGYPDFGPFTVQQVDVPDLKGNHSHGLNGDFGKADAMAPNGAADYASNTWHHHENGVTVQEVPSDIHKEFTHRGGVSTIKQGNKKCS